MVDVQVKGTETAARQLKAINDRITRRELRLAYREGAEVVLHAARSNCPIRTGNLVRSLEIFDAPRKRKEARVWIGPEKAGWYAHMVEFGTRAGTARKSKKGKRKGVKKLGHGATPAQPFLRPAMDENAREVERAVATHLQNYLNRRR